MNTRVADLEKIGIVKLLKMKNVRKGEYKQVAFKFFVVALMLFAVGNFLFFFLNQLKYNLSLRTLRKGLYTLFILGISLGLLLDEIKFYNWQILLYLTAVVIFIDLAILLTPSIMKIWKAEFQYTDYVENMILTNRKAQKATVNRVVTMSDMIQNAGTYFEELEEANDSDELKKQLESYLKEYTSKYGLIFQLWDINITPEVVTPEDTSGLSEVEIEVLAHELGLIKEIKKVLINIERLNTYSFEEELESHFSALYRLEIVTLLKEDSMLIPILNDDINMIIVLKNVKGELLEVDAIHITNLTYIFYSYA